MRRTLKSKPAPTNGPVIHVCEGFERMALRVLPYVPEGQGESTEEVFDCRVVWRQLSCGTRWSVSCRSKLESNESFRQGLTEGAACYYEDGEAQYFVIFDSDDEAIAWLEAE